MEIQDDGEILRIKVFDFNKELVGVRTRNVKLSEQWRQPENVPLFPFNHINISCDLPLLIAEGETSALTVYQLLNKNVIGTPGTTFKSEWLKYFIGVPKVYIIPDSDSAGEQLSMRIQLEFSKINVPVEILKIPEKYADISQFYLKTNSKTIENWYNQKTKIRTLLTKDELKIKHSGIFCYTDFVNYGEFVGDMPICFLEGLSLIALSSVLSNKLKWKGTSVMPDLKTNLAFILAADSTRARKSETLRILAKLIIDLDEEILLPQYFSPEALINIMSDRDGINTLLIRDEWGRFQEKLKKADWTKGTKELLIQLIDGYGFKKETVGKGKVMVKNPYLSVAGAATIESLMSSLDETDLLSGYVTRFIFLSPMKLRKRKSLAEVTDTTETYSELLHNFQRLQMNSGFKINSKIEKFRIKDKKVFIETKAPPYVVVFKDDRTLLRFDQFEAQMEELDDKYPHLSPIHTRLAWFTLRVSILLASANFFKNEPENSIIEINYEDLIYSIKLCSKWLKYQRRVIEKIGATAFENVLGQIVKFLITPKSRSQIMRRFSLSSKITNDIRDTLLQRAIIEILSEKTKTKHTEVWRLR